MRPRLQQEAAERAESFFLCALCYLLFKSNCPMKRILKEPLLHFLLLCAAIVRNRPIKPKLQQETAEIAERFFSVPSAISCFDPIVP